MNANTGANYGQIYTCLFILIVTLPQPRDCE